VVLVIALLAILVAGNAMAYRAMYIAPLIGYAGSSWNRTGPEGRNLVNALVWLGGGVPPVNVCMLPSYLGNYGSYYTSSLDAYYGEITIERRLMRPILASNYTGCDVLWMGDAWTCSQNSCYSVGDGQEILDHLQSNDAGLLLDSGSMDDAAITSTDSNWNTFHEMMGLFVDDAGARCTYPPPASCDCVYPWGYNSQSCSPWQAYGHYPYFNTIDNTHETFNVPYYVPNQYTPASYYAHATWMAVTDAVPVGMYHTNLHGGESPTGWPGRSLYTVFGGGEKLPIEINFEFRDHPFKGHPVFMWAHVVVSDPEPGEPPAQDVLPMDFGALSFSADTDSMGRPSVEPDVNNGEYYYSSMVDADNDGWLDYGDSMTVSFAVILPLGPPDETIDITAKYCDPMDDKRCGKGTAEVTTDSCKYNVPGDPLDEMGPYRHYQKAGVFTRTAWRNGDPTVMPALELIRTNTDQGFKDAHTLTSTTSPGPGNYNLELIHENLDEGNCQFGVTGAWLRTNL
jgi:hypothetical protein